MSVTELEPSARSSTDRRCRTRSTTARQDKRAGAELALERTHGDAHFGSDSIDIRPSIHQTEDDESLDLLDEGFRRFVGGHAADIEQGKLGLDRCRLPVSA